MVTDTLTSNQDIRYKHTWVSLGHRLRHEIRDITDAVLDLNITTGRKDYLHKRLSALLDIWNSYETLTNQVECVTNATYSAAWNTYADQTRARLNYQRVQVRPNTAAISAYEDVLTY